MSPTTKTSTSKSSDVRLSELARHVVVPDGIAKTAWPSVVAKCGQLGIGFDPWQHALGKLLLAKRSDGLYATAVGGCVLSIPRQVGKTFQVGSIVFALCLLNPGLTVLWTAHRMKTAAETFEAMQAMAARSKVKPYVEAIYTGSGDESVVFTNGSRILFGARERGFGRGFAGVGVLMFDEAQILTENAIDDMIPATNQATNPLIFFAGTPPKPTDAGEVFRRKRSEALSGDDHDTLYVEFSADSDADVADWAQVAKANPSYPKRTGREAILRMRKNLSEESYRREGLGIWDDDLAEADPFGPGRWKSCESDIEPPAAPMSIGIAVSLDRTSASIASAATLAPAEDDDVEDDELPVFVAPVDQRPEVDWLVGEVKRIQEEHDCTVLADEKGGVADMREAFEDADVDVTWVKLEEYVEACSDIYDRVRRGPSRLVHPGTDVAGLDDEDAAVALSLEKSVKGADWRSVGDGRRVWGRKKSSSDVAMLEAATFAIMGAVRGKSTYEERGLVTL